MNFFELPVISIASLLLFFVAAVGLTHIVVEGVIVKTPRDWLKARLPKWFTHLISCYQCAGTWCGFLCAFIILSHNPLVVFVCGMASSILSMLTANLINYLEASTLSYISEDLEED